MSTWTQRAGSAGAQIASGHGQIVTHSELSERLQHILAAEPDLAHDAAALARRVRAEAGVISDVDLLDILRTLRHDTAGLGVLEPLLAQPAVTDVVVNGPERVFIDRGAGLELSSVRFSDQEELRRLATRLAIAAGARLDDAQPCADGRLPRPDGTMVRIHALLSPPAVGGPHLSLRVLRQAQVSLDSLVERGAVPSDIAVHLRELVAARVSFLVIGGTGSGKTTLLSALLAQAPATERVLIIEDTTELAPQHPHVVSLVARRANAEGRGEISMSLLLRQALRMRPDRIVVGEIRGAEVVDLLAALNTGHDGGAGTLHANSLHEVPARMEALAALGGLDRVGLHSQLAAAVHVVLAMHRRADGVRELAQIGLLTGNPVTAQVVWSSSAGPQSGFEDFLRLVDGAHKEAP